jgi:hypothetical protein
MFACVDPLGFIRPPLQLNCIPACEIIAVLLSNQEKQS